MRSTVAVVMNTATRRRWSGVSNATLSRRRGAGRLLEARGGFEDGAIQRHPSECVLQLAEVSSHLGID